MARPGQAPLLVLLLLAGHLDLDVLAVGDDHLLAPVVHGAGALSLAARDAHGLLPDVKVEHAEGDGNGGVLHVGVPDELLQAAVEVGHLDGHLLFDQLALDPGDWLAVLLADKDLVALVVGLPDAGALLLGDVPALWQGLGVGPLLVQLAAALLGKLVLHHAGLHHLGLLLVKVAAGEELDPAVDEGDVHALGDGDGLAGLGHPRGALSLDLGTDGGRLEVDQVDAKVLVCGEDAAGAAAALPELEGQGLADEEAGEDDVERSHAEAVKIG